MRIARLFHPAPLAPNSAVTLTADATRHARSVLRLGQDQEVELFDGEGMACRGRLQLGPGALVQVRLDTLCTQQPAPLPHVELALGVSKGERMDLAIQKAVELGVGAITPLITQRSVVRLDPKRAEKRLQHWRGVVRSACEQCGRNRLPHVASPIPLEPWLGTAQAPALALMPTPGAAHSLRTLSPPREDRVRLLIGPEGGLSDAERAAAEALGYLPVSLGPRVLRTETAAIATVTAVMLLWGDLG